MKMLLVLYRRLIAWEIIKCQDLTHISFDDAEEELKRMEEFRKAQAEIEKKNDAKAVSQEMFKVV